MKLRIIMPAVGIALWIASIAGCPVRPDTLDQTTPDSGTSVAASTPTGDAGAADAPSGSDSTPGAAADDAPATPPPDATSADGGTAADAGSSGASGGTSQPGSGSGATGGSSGNATAVLTGTFHGTLTGTRQEALNGGSPATFSRTVTINVSFDASGKPTSVLVPGFATIPDLSFSVQDVGDEQTQSGVSSGISYNVTVRVTRAAYTANSAELDLAITIDGQGGSLTQSGTGTQQIRMTLNGDGTLAYSSQTHYQVRQQAGSVGFDTTQTFDEQGTLDPQ